MVREFVYFSGRARTSGNWEDLMQAGRMDIVCNVIIHTFFISNAMRDDVKLHLIFYGQPDPPKHIELIATEETSISKKDVAGLIKRILYKYKSGKKTEVFPGCFVEKKSLLQVIEELKNEGKEIYILDKKGEDIRKAEINDKAVFLLGDQEGLPRKELKRLESEAKLISIGRKTYFSSQVITILNNELDRRES
jgi:tRNA (pseudouridine54-N1)-methyltransferase